MATSLKLSLTTVFETLNFYKIKYNTMHGVETYTALQIV